MTVTADRVEDAIDCFGIDRDPDFITELDLLDCEGRCCKWKSIQNESDINKCEYYRDDGKCLY